MENLWCGANFQSVPKAELHLHLSGAYPKEYLISLAAEEEKHALETALDKISNKLDYHEVFQVFGLVHKLVDTEEKVQKGVEALCSALRHDGVTYVEIRSGLKNLRNGTERYLQAILEGIQAHISSDFQAKVLLSLQRNSSILTVQDTIELALKYQKQGVVGIDISGDSTLGKIDLILPELLQAKDAGLSFVLHLGENPNEVDQIKLLTALHPKRVGHGVHLVPEARDWILSRKIPLEVCLTSSVLVQMVEEYDQHPGISYFRKGHPIVLCTDDPLLFSTNLSRELQRAQDRAGLSEKEVEEIIKNSFRFTLSR